MHIGEEDRKYIDYMRGFSILRVMLMHLGLGWFYPPYSNYIGVFFLLLFFVSGAVNYNSFLRSSNSLLFYLKRIVSIVMPFYLFFLVVLVFSYFEDQTPVKSIGDFFAWMYLWPKQEMVFFPIGQIWFIHVLALITILSVPVYMASRNNRSILVVFSVAGIALAFISQFFPIASSVRAVVETVMPRQGGQVWTAIVLISVYFLGAVHYEYCSKLKGKSLVLISLTFAAVAFANNILLGRDYDYVRHFHNKTFFYIALSLSAIYLVLWMKPVVISICDRFKILDWILTHASKNSYGLFLLHTLVLFYVESIFGWEDLSGNQALAIVRLILVIVITMAIVKPFTLISNKMAKYLLYVVTVKFRPQLAMHNK